MSSILNVEIKAYTNNATEIKNILKTKSALNKGIDHQIDTYFKTSHGRLKLRKGNIENTLIFYARDNQSGPKQSKIELERLSENNNIRNVLEASNGVLVEVDKHRDISFVDNVKFHVDEVKDLGSFVEIEAISENNQFTAQELYSQCKSYMDLFGIKDEDLISCSYSDMLLARQNDLYRSLEEKAQAFYLKLKNEKCFSDMNLGSLVMDHLCYRVESQERYEELKNEFCRFSELIISSDVNGREISTYKLHLPFMLDGNRLAVIELPSPKAGSPYLEGFEHAEFVTDLELKTIPLEFSEYDYDTKGVDKELNAELKVKLAKNFSIKFHNQSLEKVIEIEKSVEK